MAAPYHTKTRTLGQLRTELSVRLGFVSVGQTAVMHEPLLNSFLQDAAEQIYAQYGDDLLYALDKSIDTVKGQRFYSFPDDCDPFKITAIVLDMNGAYRPIYRGIDPHIRTVGNTDESRQGIPSHWDISAGDDPDNPGKMELWRVPNEEWTMSLSYYPPYHEFGWGVIEDPPYIDDSAPCPIYPSRLVLLMAIANAKQHFGMGDAQAYFSQFDQMLMKHKASLLAGLRFKRDTEFGRYDDYGHGNRRTIGDDIVVDLTPPDSVTSETGDTILPESSTETGSYTR